MDTAPVPGSERRRPGGSRRERPPADLPVVPAAAPLSRNHEDGVQRSAGVSPAQAAPKARLGGRWQAGFLTCYPVAARSVVRGRRDALPYVGYARRLSFLLHRPG